MDRGGEAASAGDLWVALGITERSRSGTLYDSVVYIDSDGSVAGVNRKLLLERGGGVGASELDGNGQQLGECLRGRALCHERPVEGRGALEGAHALADEGFDSLRNGELV